MKRFTFVVITVLTVLLFAGCHGTGQDPDPVNPAGLEIGDAYQGGKIAYILQPADPGFDAVIIHGLIAATVDQSSGIAWTTDSATGEFVNGTGLGGTSTDYGTGQVNTTAMMAQTGYTGGAATVCDGYSNPDTGTGVYTDWYLPSKDELHMLALNKIAIGGFSTSFYWSSSESDKTHAWAEIIDNSTQGPVIKSSVLVSVRPVRSF